MKHLSVLCTMHNGKLKLFDRPEFDSGLAQFGDGEELVLTLEPAGRKRTQKQNRFFHGPILKAFMTTGLHKQEAKDMLCLRFIPREVRQMDGVVVLVPGHTSDLDVGEFNGLIDACIQLAAENDINIEDADEWRRNRSAA